ncbi:hypothetical protein NMY22_g1622 [Coprinellus aureogranulatus]|nr:hypothetical protein NMY22_g1622 [Coprinellus aureogranulatus]
MLTQTDGLEGSNLLTYDALAPYSTLDLEPQANASLTKCPLRELRSSAPRSSPALEDADGLALSGCPGFRRNRGRRLQRRSRGHNPSLPSPRHHGNLIPKLCIACGTDYISPIASTHAGQDLPQFETTHKSRSATTVTTKGRGRRHRCYGAGKTTPRLDKTTRCKTRPRFETTSTSWLPPNSKTPLPRARTSSNPHPSHESSFRSSEKNAALICGAKALGMQHRPSTRLRTQGTKDLEWVIVDTLLVEPLYGGPVGPPSHRLPSSTSLSRRRAFESRQKYCSKGWKNRAPAVSRAPKMTLGFGMQKGREQDDHSLRCHGQQYQSIRELAGSGPSAEATKLDRGRRRLKRQERKEGWKGEVSSARITKYKPLIRPPQPSPASTLPQASDRSNGPDTICAMSSSPAEEEACGAIEVLVLDGEHGGLRMGAEGTAEMADARWREAEGDRRGRGTRRGAIRARDHVEVDPREVNRIRWMDSQAAQAPIYFPTHVTLLPRQLGRKSVRSSTLNARPWRFTMALSHEVLHSSSHHLQTMPPARLNALRILKAQIPKGMTPELKKTRSICETAMWRESRYIKAQSVTWVVYNPILHTDRRPPIWIRDPIPHYTIRAFDRAGRQAPSVPASASRTNTPAPALTSRRALGAPPLASRSCSLTSASAFTSASRPPASTRSGSLKYQSIPPHPSLSVKTIKLTDSEDVDRLQRYNPYVNNELPKPIALYLHCHGWSGHQRMTTKIEAALSIQGTTRSEFVKIVVGAGMPILQADKRAAIWDRATALHEEHGLHTRQWWHNAIVQAASKPKHVHTISRWRAYVLKHLRLVNDEKRKNNEPCLKPGDVSSESAAKWNAMTDAEKDKETAAYIKDFETTCAAATEKVPDTAVRSFHEVKNAILKWKAEAQALAGRNQVKILFAVMRSNFTQYNRPSVWGTSVHVEDFMLGLYRTNLADFRLHMEAYMLTGINGITCTYAQSLSELKLIVTKLIHSKLNEAAAHHPPLPPCHQELAAEEVC